MILAHGQVGGPWAYELHWEVWLLVLSLAGGYFWTLRRLGPRYTSPGDEPASRRQMASFLLGVLSLWVAADWPVHEIAENYLFSVHMLQHMVFAFVSAPLMLLGLPDWLLRLLLKPKPLKAFVGTVTRPLVAMLLFNGFLVFSHWPTFVDLSLRLSWFHFLAHAVLMGVSLAMWWPVIGPLAEMPRLAHGPRLFYLFLQTIVPTVPASFLTFADFPFYPLYEAAPRAFGISAITDQRVAGLIMKLGGGLFLWSVIAVLFFRWSAREESGLADRLDLQDMELQLNRPEQVK